MPQDKVITLLWSDDVRVATFEVEDGIVVTNANGIAVLSAGANELICARDKATMHTWIEDMAERFDLDSDMLEDILWDLNCLKV